MKKSEQRLEPEPDVVKRQESVTVSFRVPVALLAEIDSLASDERRSRGSVLRFLLEEALQERTSRRGGPGNVRPIA